MSGVQVGRKGKKSHRRRTGAAGGKKTRNLGKWQDGFNCRVTKQYAEWRRKRRKMARKSRALNRKRAKR